MKAYFSGGHWDKFGTSFTQAYPSSLRLVHRNHRRWRSLRSSAVPAAVRASRPKPLSATSSVALIPESDHTDSALRQFALAEAKLGHYETAIAAFDILLEHCPDNAVDYNNRGLIFFEMKQYEMAIADYNRALALNPSLDSAYNNRANYHAAMGELLEAILDYDTAIEINPNNIRAWVNQGITFRDMEMYEHALENFDVALHLAQHSMQLQGHIFAERGRVHHLSGDWNCAIADYDRAITHLPDPLPPFTTSSVRLRVQVEIWLDDLLSPLNL